MSPRVRYETAPKFNRRNPMCDACMVEVGFNGDGWECPRCGTYWDPQHDEEKPGTLFEEWAGEPNHGVLRSIEDGWESVPDDLPGPLAGRESASETRARKRY